MDCQLLYIVLQQRVIVRVVRCIINKVNDLNMIFIVHCTQMLIAMSGQVSAHNIFCCLSCYLYVSALDIVIGELIIQHIFIGSRIMVLWFNLMFISTISRLHRSVSLSGISNN